MTDKDIRQWATRVVDLYASRVTMNLPDQGTLERDIARRFAAAHEGGKGVTDWTEIANAALDEWEQTHSHRGIRIGSFSLTGKLVTEKRRSF